MPAKTTQPHDAIPLINIGLENHTLYRGCKVTRESTADDQPARYKLESHGDRIAMKIQDNTRFLLQRVSGSFLKLSGVCPVWARDIITATIAASDVITDLWVYNGTHWTWIPLLNSIIAKRYVDCDALPRIRLHARNDDLFASDALPQS